MHLGLKKDIPKSWIDYWCLNNFRLSCCISFIWWKLSRFRWKKQKVCCIMYWLYWWKIHWIWDSYLNWEKSYYKWRWKN